MDWLKGFFRNAEYNCQGSLIKLADPQDNYTKKTEFMNATLIVKNKELFVKNDDYDSDQDQIDYISFPLNTDSQLVHYTISDEEVKIECVKWVNLNSQVITDAFYGFEFESPHAFETFASFVSKYVQIDEEGYQDPSLRLANLKQAQNTLAVTSKIIPSNITKVQIKPDILPEEEKELRPVLQFKRIALQSLSHLYPAETILFMSPGDLYLLGPNLSTPLLTDRGIAFLIIRHPEYRMSIDIVREEQIVMRILIDSNFYSKIDEEKKYVSWVENVTDTERRTWRTELLDSVQAIEGLINIARYEDEKKAYVSALSEEDQKWIRGDEESQVVQEEEKKEAMMEIDFTDDSRPVVEEDMDEIVDTVQSWKGPNVYASRKGKITMYSDSGNGLERSSVFPMDFTPSGALLQNEDSQIMFLNKAKGNIVYNLDLNRGQIVEEFTIGKMPLHALCHPSKFSQLTNSGLFLGVTDKSLYTIDPRVPEKIVQDYTYSTNIYLSCMATTAQGHIAVGSEKGDIRLYKEIGKKSTTVFPGLGHPIRSIDSTKDGEWLLATTDNYLMVIQTKLDGELAYTKALSRKRKAPRKLQLGPEDIAKYQILNVKFSEAKFNVGENTEESAIITSTGNLMVIWNFASVKIGKLDDYAVKVMEENVVKNEFKFSEENALITYKKSLKIQNGRWNIKRK